MGNERERIVLRQFEQFLDRKMMVHNNLRNSWIKKDRLEKRIQKTIILS